MNENIVSVVFFNTLNFFAFDKYSDLEHAPPWFEPLPRLETMSPNLWTQNYEPKP